MAIFNCYVSSPEGTHHDSIPRRGPKNLTFSEAFHEAGWARAGGWASYAHSLGNFIFHDMNIGDIKIIYIYI